MPLGSGEVIITVLRALVDSGSGICTLSAQDAASRQIFNTLRPSSRVARLADQSTITSSGAGDLDYHYGGNGANVAKICFELFNGAKVILSTTQFNDVDVDFIFSRPGRYGSWMILNRGDHRTFVRLLLRGGVYYVGLAVIRDAEGRHTLRPVSLPTGESHQTVATAPIYVNDLNGHTITCSFDEDKHATVAQLEVHQDYYTSGLTCPEVLATTGNVVEINELSPEVDGSHTSARATTAPGAGAAATEAAESPRPRLLNIRKRSEWEATWGFPGKQARRLLASANFGINSWAETTGASSTVPQTAALRRRAVPSEATTHPGPTYMLGECWTFDLTRWYAKPDLEGNHLGFLAVELHTDRPWSWLMRDHSGVEDALDALQHFVRTTKRVRLRALWADFDPTWARHGDDVVLGQTRVMKWCIREGVRLLATAPYKHNRRVESVMGSIVYIVNCLLVASLLGHVFWGRAFLCATFLYARRSNPSSRKTALQNGQTRYHAYHGHPADLTVHIGPFGMSVWVSIDGARASQHVRLGKAGIYLGPSQSLDGWNVLVLESMKVMVVYFLKANRDLSLRPAEIMEREEMLNSQVSAVNPDVKLFAASVRSLFDNDTSENYHNKAMVVDRLTGLPIRMETVELDNGENALLEFGAIAQVSTPLHLSSEADAGRLHHEDLFEKATTTAPAENPGDGDGGSASDDHGSSAVPQDTPDNSHAAAVPPSLHGGGALHRPTNRNFMGRFQRKRDGLSEAERDALYGLPESTSILLKQVNPKTGASHERYEKYKAATTIAGFYEKGAVRQDLGNDFERGYLQICTLEPLPVILLHACLVPPPIMALLDEQRVNSLKSELELAMESSTFKPGNIPAAAPDEELPPANNPWQNADEDFLVQVCAVTGREPEELVAAFESPVDFMEQVTMQLVKNYEDVEEQFRAAEGRPRLNAQSERQQMDALMKTLLLSTDFEKLTSKGSAQDRALQENFASLMSVGEEDPTASVRTALRSNDADDWRAKLRDEWFRLFAHFGSMEPIGDDEANAVPFKERIRMKWALTVKLHAATGKFNRRKARLCCCQIVKQFSVEDSFSPTVLQESVRLILQIAITNDLWAFSLDVAGAYLFADADPEMRKLVLHAPPYLDQILSDEEYPKVPSSGKRARYFRPVRAIYGLQASSRLWYERYTKFLEEMGFQPTKVDSCVWFRFDSPTDFIIICIFSDDNLLVGKGVTIRDTFLAAWEREFQQSPDSEGIGSLTEFLGMKIDRRADRILLSAPKLIAKLPSVLGTRPVERNKREHRTPISPSHHCDDAISETNPLIDVKERDCRVTMGLILWIVLACRPDLCMYAAFMAKYVGRGATKHVAIELDRLGWFIVDTAESHILNLRKSDNKLVAAADASLCNETFNGKLQTWYGYYACFGEFPVTGACVFRATTAKSIITSTRDAELVAGIHCVHHIVQLRLFLAEIGLKQFDPTPIYSDSMAAVAGVRTPHVNNKSRWMAIRFDAIKQTVTDMLVAFQHIEGKSNASDIYTKILDGATFYRHSMTVLGTPICDAQWKHICALLDITYEIEK